MEEKMREAQPEDKTKVLITGAGGQLGLELQRVFREKGYEVYGMDRDSLDITDAEQCHIMLNRVRPDVVIHAAAYTQVDQAESDPDTAYRVNAYGTRNIAAAAEAAGAKLVYISTDYVFNGKGTMPYSEFHPTDPVNVYGCSKWEGEELVRQLHTRFFVVRTSWVYGAGGSNFVRTMLKVGKRDGRVSVVADQIGCPTYTRDLASVIEQLSSTQRYGTYHVSGAGSCSWYEFACAIFEDAGMRVDVVPVTTGEYPRPAPRPAYSVLDHQALRLNGFHPIRHWREALQDFLRSSHET
ncbi:dTDP-4-dehydrorhamnose reductase [Paenibacillus tuaregi]|uniref:dTDP-4-dehydrorhamnose reductase n=1 Tax=Paenibacillus tuaregi TaxID=1816681 RepID=UPI00292A3C5C|nr:dTDP-4-dehydrorhamnose reductase [Paenibacillus tuaregi]